MKSSPLKRVFSTVYNSSPQDIVHRIRSRLRSAAAEDDASKNSQRLADLFKVYRTDNLRSISGAEFRASIQSRLGVTDPEAEGYSDHELERQRAPSVTFLWGHTHDFGDFTVEGRMRDRHITVLARFAALFRIPLDEFRGRDVFDVGCWTGGTSLLLAALGSQVVAIEEVKKYAETASFLARSFGVDDRVSVRSLSIYECHSAEFHDRFDIAFFPGVVYHLSDPVVALRILYNSLRVGGVILVESAGIDTTGPLCRFEGSLARQPADGNRLNQAGWNWFIPSGRASANDV